MGTFGEYIKSALSSIRNNKVRSFLTMLGIIIGISAVLTVLIIGDGMKATVNSTIDDMGATTITISLDNTKTDKTFTKENIDDIEASIKNIYGVSVSLSAYGTVKGRKGSYDLSISGGMEASSKASGVKVLHGRYYTKNDVDDAKKVVVISQTMANYIFGYENVVGKTLEITSADLTSEFTVVGVKEDTPMDKAFASFADEIMFTCVMPYTTVADAFDINDSITSMTLYLDSEYKNAVIAQSRAVVENIVGLRGENAVKISAGAGFDKTTDSIMSIITSVIAIIAAISLLVGGIGVMNIP